MTTLTGRSAADRAPFVPGHHDGVFLSIQYLRGIASVMVLLYHAGYDLNLITEGSRPHWLASGVDIFFVVSGFVMVASTAQRPVTARRFLASRIARVVPIYWVATLAMIAILAFRGQTLPSLREVALSFLFIFYFNERAQDTSPILGPGWTLNYEIYFYLVFAALIRLPVTMRIALMGVLFVAITALRPIVPADSAFLTRMTSPIPLEFVAGMVIGHYRARIMQAPALLGVAAIAIAFAALALLNPPLPRVAFFAPPAVLIVLGGVILERHVGQRRLGALGLLGDTSYSLYLTHPLLLALLIPISAAPDQVLPLGVVIVAGSIALGFAAYYWVEVPTTRAARRLLGGARPKPPGDRTGLAASGD
ncbi:acyltransferase family protein [Sphingomonas mucosissima]|uniref:Acyltransferase family protein n=1 Tax=Sphingomonas mucosissima TaxID=370959 RepID=A0A245ZRL8_9SPHN|nr:acyltransferase [Sphingomonas mucosissima]OWK32370.1 acyltransferase family protein [Sphingomonas mucosissima]